MNFSSVSRPRTLIALAFLTLAGAGCNKDSAPATDTSSAPTSTKMASAPTASGSKAPATMDSASGAAFVSTKGYEVMPPAGWKTPMSDGAAPPAADNPEEKFVASDGTKNEFTVAVLPSGGTLDSYKATFSDAMSKKDIKPEVSDVKVSGDPAFQMLYSVKDTSGDLNKFHQVYALHGDKLAILTYTAKEADYAKQDSAFQPFVDSFKWK